MIEAPRSPGTQRTRLRNLALLSATALTVAALSPHAASAAQFGVVVNQIPDPILTNLNIPATAPTQGMWSGVASWPLNAIHMSVLPTGKILTFGSPIGDPGSQNGRFFDIWDPYSGAVNGNHVNFQEPGFVNSFCSAMSFQPDGSLLVSGGIFDAGVDKSSAVLNPAATGVTTLGAKLANDRYYSTMIVLPNGRPLIMGGSYPYLGGWADPQGSIDKGYMTGMTPETYDGTNWNSLFGANSRDAFGPDNSRWWYPRAWVAPSGKVFGITAEKMWLLDPTGNGAVTTMPFKEPQRNASSATDAPNVGPVSTAVMYDTGKILQVGGNSYDNGNGFLSSSRATTVDINGANPVVTDTAPMNFGRGWANATVLPTGTVVVTGGSKFNDQAGGNTVLAAEMWDPRSGTWTVGASNAIYRGYHSTAGLLQNGALIISGGGAPGPVNNANVEFYYPPYLFTSVNGQAGLAPRPQIVSLTSNRLAHGQSMQFEVSSQNGVAQVVLMGLTQVTHSFNSNQRRVPVAFSAAGQVVTVQTPATPNLAPPGYYQLVAIDQKGVPSPGVIVSLGAAVAGPPQAATPVIVATAGAGAGTGAGTGTGGTGTGGTTGGGTGTGTGSTGTGGAGTPAAGTTTLKAVHSGMCLSVAGANGNDGAPVTQQACTGAPEQSWKMSAVTGGYTITNAATGKCLDVAGVSTANGAQVWQWTCNGQANQTWASKPQTGGNAYLSLNSNLCLDISGISMQAGAGTIQWACWGGANQTFITSTTTGTNSGGTTSGGTTNTGGVPPVPTTSVALESASNPGTYARRMYGDMMAAATVIGTVDRLESTFKVVAGVGGQGVSFQSIREPNRYIRHANFTMYLSKLGDIGNKGDAGFTRRASLAQTCGCTSGACVSYESVTWPGYYIRNRPTGVLGIDTLTDTPPYRQQASFCERPQTP